MTANLTAAHPNNIENYTKIHRAITIADMEEATGLAKAISRSTTRNAPVVSNAFFNFFIAKHPPCFRLGV